MNFIKTFQDTFLSNPVAVLDRRIQMRGSRPAILWTIYLGILTVIAVLAYYGTGARAVTISQLQANLNGFTVAIQWALSALVLLAAPALTALSISVERQRRSLELVFSAPTSPLMYTLGKALSAYRTIWLLLVLALPILATGYMLGGATWSDLLATLAMISFNALVLCCIALCVSANAKSPLLALILSYLACGAYQLAVAGADPVTVEGTGGLFKTGLGAGLNAFTAQVNANYMTTFGGVFLPTVAWAGITTLLICSFLVLGAASSLTPYNSIETKVFRVSSLIMTALLTGILCSSIPHLGDLNIKATQIAMPAALLVVSIMAPIIGAVDPFGDRKTRGLGWFNFRQILRSHPSSMVPYLLSTVLACAVGSMFVTGIRDWNAFDWMRLGYTALSAVLIGLAVRRIIVTAPTIKAGRVVSYLAIALYFIAPALVLAWCAAVGLSGPDVTTYHQLGFFFLNELQLAPLVFGLTSVASWTALAIGVEAFKTQKEVRLDILESQTPALR